MPAKSKAQRQLMAIAEHHPEEVYSENKGVLKMSHEQLHDFAAGKEKGLPKHKPAPKKKKAAKPQASGLNWREHWGRRKVKKG